MLDVRRGFSFTVEWTDNGCSSCDEYERPVNCTWSVTGCTVCNDTGEAAWPNALSEVRGGKVKCMDL